MILHKYSQSLDGSCPLKETLVEVTTSYKRVLMILQMLNKYSAPVNKENTNENLNYHLCGL